MQDGFYVKLGLLLAITAISVLAIRTLKRFLRVPRGVQKVIKRVYPAIDGLVRSIIGEDGSRFTPIIGCIFALVMALDLLAFQKKLISPVASIWITAGFALAAFALVQYHEIRRVGLRSHCMSALGNPRWLLLVKLPVLLIKEFIKPIILAMKLLGSILGQDILILILILIGIEVFGNMGPVSFPMVTFELVTSFIQAIMFSMLVAAYISAVQRKKVIERVG